MHLKKTALGAMLGLLAFFTLAGVAGAAERSYTEGTVSTVTSIRTVDGRSDDYMAWLAGPWKKFNDEAKAAGLIVDYNVYSTAPRGPNDPDLYLVVTYKNMGALDDLDARTDAMAEKIFGNQQAANAETVARGKIRTVIGSELIRELKLK
jgi:hypothetical protein